MFKVNNKDTRTTPMANHKNKIKLKIKIKLVKINLLKVFTKTISKEM